MKRITLLACVLAALLAPSLARAAGNTYEGDISVGNPATATGAPAVAELVGSCDNTAPTEGFDAAWVKLSEDDAGLDGTLSATGDTGLEDADAYFYDSACNFIDASWNAGIEEAGTVPENAAWVAVDLFTGLNAHYTLTIG
jgi:hypothetical protein